MKQIIVFFSNCITNKQQMGEPIVYNFNVNAENGTPINLFMEYYSDDNIYEDLSISAIDLHNRVFVFQQFNGGVDPYAMGTINTIIRLFSTQNIIARYTISKLRIHLIDPETNEVLITLTNTDLSNKEYTPYSHIELLLKFAIEQHNINGVFK